MQVAAQVTVTDKAEADALFRDGKKLMSQKRYAEACRKLEQSQKLDPAPGTLLNLATCHEAEGKIASAWVEFSDALAQAKAEKNHSRIAYAKERVSALEPKLPRLSIAVAQQSPGLKVTRDGGSVSEASFGTAVPVDPGSHKVEATAEGYKPFSIEITLEPGQSKTVIVPALEALPPPVASSAPPPPPPPPPPSFPTPLQTAGLVAGGVGILALGVGGFFGVRTLSLKSKADDGCPTATTCTPDGLKANDDAYTSANIANVGIGLGVVGVGVGVALLLVGAPSSQPEQPAALRIAPVLGGGVAGAMAQGRF